MLRFKGHFHTIYIIEISCIAKSTNRLNEFQEFVLKLKTRNWEKQKTYKSFKSF